MGCGSSKTKVEQADNGTAKKAPEGGKVSVTASGKEANQEDIRDKYELGKVLGSGSFGQVREARLKDGGPTAEVRAVKMIEPDKGDGEWSNQAIFVREVDLLQQLSHENIIRFYDFYEDIHFLYVVMELCKGGEVFAKIVEMKRFSEKNAALLAQQMLRALNYIHDLKIAHRDIKAENFMLSEPSVTSAVKMIDFGMATKFKQDQVLTELCGSPHYLSPELIGQKYNHLADIWAFGVLLYLLMYGHYPYDAKHPRDIMVKILTEPIKWTSKAKLSKEAIDFLTKLLEHNIKKRLTAEQAMEHPWMRKANSVQEEPALDVEVVRSAHKKVTGTKKQIAPEIDKIRNEKLQKIDEDFSKGIRHGQRLGETPKEEYMSKPEFVRRENKITTAPSTDLNSRRTSFSKMIAGAIGGGKKENKANAIAEEEEEDEAAASAANKAAVAKPAAKPLPRGRSQSMQVDSISNPRRLSYLPGITKQDETSFTKLYEEKKKNGTSAGALDLASPVVPGSPAVPDPQEGEA